MKVKQSYKLDPRKEDHLGLYDSPLRRYLSGKRLQAIERAARSNTTAGMILELGCGHGEVLEKLYSPESSITGIDINPNSIAIAKKRFSNRDNVKILEGDIRKLAYADETFDLIVCSEVIEHIPNPIEVLAEIRRLLKKDGIFVSTVPLEYLLIVLRTLILPLRLIKGKGITVDAHLHNFTRGSYRKLLSEYFSVTDIRYVEFMIRILAVCKKK